jgi:hypothetical protein
MANPRATVQSIFIQQISLHFEGGARFIPRQSTTIIEVPNGTLTVRGQTNFTQGPWVTYSGYLGDWQSPISNGRVRTPYPINPALRP